MTIKRYPAASVSASTVASLVTNVTSGAPTTPASEGAIAIDTTNDAIYIRSGNAWVEIDTEATAIVQDGAPASPVNGDIWYESDTGRTLIYYADGSSNQWVEVGVASAAGVSGIDGKVQFAEGNTFASDTLLHWDNTNNRLGVGTASPSTTLHIGGDLTVDGTTTTINSTTLTIDDKNIELGSVDTPSDTTADGGGITLKGASDKTILWENDTDAWHFNQGINVTAGNVGIGTSSPDQALTVAGNLQGYGIHVDSSSGAGIEIDRGASNNSHGVLFQTAGTTDWYIGNHNDGDALVIKDGSWTGTDIAAFTPTGLGIGDTSPAQTLSVAGTASFTDSIQTGSETFTQEPWAGSTIALGNYGGIGTQGSYRTTMSWNWERGTDSGFYHLNVNSLAQAGYYAIGSAGHLWGFNDSYSPVGWPTERMRLTQTGLGIGNASPGAKLHITDAGNAIRMDRSGYDSYGYVHSAGGGIQFYNYTDSRTEMYFAGSGRIGIGTTSTGGQVHIYTGTGWDSTDSALKVQNDETQNSYGNGILVEAGPGNGYSYPLFLWNNDSDPCFYVRDDARAWFYGTVTKAGGSFDIPHPTKGGDWRLRHSFIEGPQADNLYRGTVTLSGGTATVDLDAVSNMTDGTWEALNRDPWTLVASSGNVVEWSLSGKTLTITSDTADAVCSWQVIGERQDDFMKSSKGDYADDDGYLIVEYEEEQPTPPEALVEATEESA